MVEGLMGEEFAQSDDHLGRSITSDNWKGADHVPARGVGRAVTSDRAADSRQGASSSSNTFNSHRRMGSEASIASSSHTMTSMGRNKPG